MEKASTENRELKMAWAFVEHTGCHVFLTGKAGTGKTTFLHQLRNKTAKKMVVTAPTGVAAVNAGGVTLHSFFQLPFGPFVPGSEASENNRQRMFRFSREKKRIIRSLDLLVIDEISMVRADLLDSVDAVLRRHRAKDCPFGGVQLLMIGDLHQLSPVARQEEWQTLQAYYDTPYFFSSRALDRNRLVTIELKHIYRQSDAGFIDLLNKVRDNCLDSGAAGLLNQRVNENFTPEPGKGWITLTTHNKKADSINAGRLREIAGPAFSFGAQVSGDFPAHAFPAPQRLELKNGAQVMFLRNDSSPDKRYFNGKIGRITAVTDQGISILCPDDRQEIRVEAAEWENIKYKVNEQTWEIEEEVIGTFRQLPLKLAWAITIHKSQGLTFDRAVIDARAAFAPGQVYVALSRCKTLEGLVLRSPVPAGGLGADAAVLDFIQSLGQDPDLQERLTRSRISFQQDLLGQCFDLSTLKEQLGWFIRLLLKYKNRVQIIGLPDPAGLMDAAQTTLFSVAEKFLNQIRARFAESLLPESDAFIQERTARASAWFQEQFSLIFSDLMEGFRVDTDNKELSKRISRDLDGLQRKIRKKLAGIESCKGGFSAFRYLRAVSGAELDVRSSQIKSAQGPVYGESDISYPELFEALKTWRDRTAEEQGVPRFHILHQKVLTQIAVHLPGTEPDLKKIKGVGPKIVETYGADILAMVNAFRKTHGIDQVVLPEKPEPENHPVKSAKKGETQRISLDLFNQGLSPVQIADKRNLTLPTVLGHLCSFVKTGSLNIDSLILPEKRKRIAAAIGKEKSRSLGAVKAALGDDCSYEEIRLVLSHLSFLGTNRNGS